MKPNHASMDILISATSQIVSAYIVNRPASEALNLTALTADVFATLKRLSMSEATAADAANMVEMPQRKPMVPVEDSIKADYLVCLEDGKRVKMLRRYLKSTYNMTPEEYRARWALPANYPMVAPNYTKVRSQLAKQIGLGRRSMPKLPKRTATSNVVGLR